MPFRHTVDRERNWLLTIATGTIPFDEVREHLLHERAEGELERPELIDATAAELAFTPAEVRKIVELLRDHGLTHRLGPTAVLVGSDYAYGMMRMLELLLGDVAALRPFRSRAEADAWLAQAPVSGAQASADSTSG